MAELSLQQVIDKLNAYFTEEQRTLVFWYDAEGQFQEDIAQIKLERAKICQLNGHNQFAVKLLLEHEDKQSNYLIYAPFAEPDVHENHLLDTSLYAKRFTADRASLILHDLHLDSDKNLLAALRQHSKFFANKERLQRFYALPWPDNVTVETLLLGMMCTLNKIKILSFDELLRSLLLPTELLSSPALQEFAKYDLLQDFWQFCRREFGYEEEVPNLFKLVRSLFLTNAARQLRSKSPATWQGFLLTKQGSVVTFLDSMRDNIVYHENYSQLAQRIEEDMQVKTALQQYEPAPLAVCDTFPCVDEILLDWGIERLLSEDLAAKLGDETIPELCQRRKKSFFGQQVVQMYDMLLKAYGLMQSIKEVNRTNSTNFDLCFADYLQTDYQVDRYYRQFYYAYDAVEHTDMLEQLRDLIEKLYTNIYLDQKLPQWNHALMERRSFTGLPQQLNFYRDYLKGKKEKIVVVISDALRYELGQELAQKLADEPKFSVQVHGMLSTLPSYTRLGMLALLPHATIDINDKGEEVLDKAPIIDLKGRQMALQKAEPKGICLRYEEVRLMKRAALRQILNGRQPVYIYHDQIDNMGEHMPEQVFSACQAAIDEIKQLLLQLVSSASITHFIVTADHGFIYKRDAIQEKDKIAGVADKNYLLKRRYIIGNKPIEEIGVCHLPLSVTLANDDKKYVSFPLNYNVFKVQGSGGLNYVHGGSSPQELVVPVIEVQAAKGHQETHPAEIRLLTMLHKITGRTLTLEFVQTEAVSDTVRVADYAMYFVDAENNKITGVELHTADNREEETAKRIFAMHFTFKNQTYDVQKQYALVITNANTGKEIFRQKVSIEIAF